MADDNVTLTIRSRLDVDTDKDLKKMRQLHPHREEKELLDRLDKRYKAEEKRIEKLRAARDSAVLADWKQQRAHALAQEKARNAERVKDKAYAEQERKDREQVAKDERRHRHKIAEQQLKDDNLARREATRARESSLEHEKVHRQRSERDHVKHLNLLQQQYNRYLINKQLIIDKGVEADRRARVRALEKENKDRELSTAYLVKRLKHTGTSFLRFSATLAKVGFVSLAGQATLFATALVGINAALAVGRFTVSAYHAALKGLAVTAAAAATAIGVAVGAYKQWQEAQLAPYLIRSSKGSYSSRFAGAQAMAASRLSRSYSNTTSGLMGIEGMQKVNLALAKAGMTSPGRSDLITSNLFNIAGGDSATAASLATTLAKDDTAASIEALKNAPGINAEALSSGRWSMGRLFRSISEGSLTGAGFTGLSDELSNSVVGRLKTEFAGLLMSFTTLGDSMLPAVATTFTRVATSIKGDLLGITTALQNYGKQSFLPFIESTLTKMSEWFRKGVVDNINEVTKYAEKVAGFFSSVERGFRNFGDWLRSYERAGDVVMGMFSQMGMAAGGRGMFQGFARMVVDNEEAFAAFGRSVGALTGSVLDLFALGQNSFFNRLDKVSGVLGSIAYTFVPALGELMASMTPILALLPDAIGGLANVLSMLAPILESLLRAIGGIGSFIQGMPGGSEITGLMLAGGLMAVRRGRRMHGAMHGGSSLLTRVRSTETAGRLGAGAMTAGRAAMATGLVYGRAAMTGIRGWGSRMRTSMAARFSRTGATSVVGSTPRMLNAGPIPMGRGSYNYPGPTRPFINLKGNRGSWLVKQGVGPAGSLGPQVGLSRNSGTWLPNPGAALPAKGSNLPVLYKEPPYSGNKLPVLRGNRLPIPYGAYNGVRFGGGMIGGPHGGKPWFVPGPLAAGISGALLGGQFYSDISEGRTFGSTFVNTAVRSPITQGLGVGTALGVFGPMMGMPMLGLGLGGATASAGAMANAYSKGKVTFWNGLGGVGGGALAGAAIGSIVPIIGTGVGAAVGAIAGAIGTGLSAWFGSKRRRAAAGREYGRLFSEYTGQITTRSGIEARTNMHTSLNEAIESGLVSKKRGDDPVFRRWALRHGVNIDAVDMGSLFNRVAKGDLSDVVSADIIAADKIINKSLKVMTDAFRVTANQLDKALTALNLGDRVSFNAMDTARVFSYFNMIDRNVGILPDLQKTALGQTELKGQARESLTALANAAASGQLTTSRYQAFLDHSAAWHIGLGVSPDIAHIAAAIDVNAKLGKNRNRFGSGHLDLAKLNMESIIGMITSLESTHGMAPGSLLDMMIGEAQGPVLGGVTRPNFIIPGGINQADTKLQIQAGLRGIYSGKTNMMIGEQIRFLMEHGPDRIRNQFENFRGTTKSAGELLHKLLADEGSLEHLMLETAKASDAKLLTVIKTLETIAGNTGDETVIPVPPSNEGTASVPPHIQLPNARTSGAANWFPHPPPSITPGE